MKTAAINHAFLDDVVAGRVTDAYYHLGVSSDDAFLERLRGIRAVVMGGSGGRMVEFAERWSALNAGAEIIAFPKEDRFVTRYSAGVLFVSHGMGMPSASIAVQEVMRLVYFLTRGDLDALDRIFWVRVGTSGGVGLPAGTVVVSTEGLMADLRPYRLLQGAAGEYWFDGTFPKPVRDEIIAANADSPIPIVTGITVATNEFFLEQFRLDGAIRMETPESKMAWLRSLADRGVANIEMEGAMFAGFLNHWGFSRFAMICVALLNRLEGDQVHATPEQMEAFNDRSGDVLFAYLASSFCITASKE